MNFDIWRIAQASRDTAAIVARAQSYQAAMRAAGKPVTRISVSKSDYRKLRTAAAQQGIEFDRLTLDGTPVEAVGA